MSFQRQIWVSLFLALGIFSAPLCKASAQSADQSKLVVFAAASLKNALDAANLAWVKAGNPAVVVSYAASSTLANQMEKGAPAEIFISADLEWMDYLKEHQKIKPQSITNLLGNELVLIVHKDHPIRKYLSKELALTAPKDATAPFALQPGLDLATLIGYNKIAMGTILSVPAGKYGKAAFEALGMWEKLSQNVVQTDNVRAALLLVSRKEAALGVVYKTDAVADKNVTVIATFPPGSHPPIIYPMGLVATSQNPMATAYLSFLRSREARAFFEEQGFTVLP